MTTADVRRFRHGLVIGKFYPPHTGHHAAIRAAAARCERLSIVVMASLAETVPLADRVAWLREEHRADRGVEVMGVRCDAPLDVGDPRIWEAQTAVMRAALAVHFPDAAAVDLVASNDDYGEELARRFDATWMRTDRIAGGPSGTAVRRDLARHWDDLAAPVRAGLVTRVVAVGAESSGTTTVSRALAERFRARGGVWDRTAWVEEYGREYTLVKWSAACRAAEAVGEAPPELDDLVWDTHDFDVVAREQTRREEQAARSGGPLLVCDTDAFATSVWERRYLGAAARGPQPWAAAPHLPERHVYLLTDHRDVPWHDDGLREGDLEIRAAMTGWFADALTRAGHSWVLLTGPLEERLALAERTVDQLLAHRRRFGEPLHGPGFEATP